MEMSSQLHARVALPPGNGHPVWIGGWVGPRFSLNSVAKTENLFIAPVGNCTPVVQAAA